MLRHLGTMLVPALTAALLGCGSPAPVGTAAAPIVEADRGAPPTTSVDPPLADNTTQPTIAGGTSPTAVNTAHASADGVEPPPSFRPPDERSRHDPDAVAQHGIQLYESRRLQLYTDIEPAAAQQLPPLLDALFDEWQAYFGELPPARDGSEFQLTAYVMHDQQAFRDAGLLPVNLPVFAHGRHQGQEFWMNDQDHEYYRRHLLLHEATHCYMQAMGGTTIDVPVWYLEGMAELFATHKIDTDGTTHFRIVPDAPDNFLGFGRLEMIAQDIQEGRALTLPQLTSLTAKQFQRIPSAYAWSWITCLLADRNPRYQDAFRELSRRYAHEGYAHVRKEVFDPLTADFAVEWTLLTRALEYRHDISATAISFAAGEPLSDDQPHVVEIDANRGWQSSGIALPADSNCTITATGEVTLADEPQPWVSQPAGITIRYAHGQPIGRLLGIVIGDVTPQSPTRRFVGDVIPIETGTTLTSQSPGTLYMRINDFNAELSDNSGSYDIAISPREDSDPRSSD